MRWLLWIVLVLMSAATPGSAAAHDDPVVTVRVMCDGFNILDMDQVLGEISDSAILRVDGTVQGADQIQAWVKQQMDDDFRIEITSMGTPQQLLDGYTLTWSAKLSRQDWRKAGIETRQASNTVAIHNGRITEWTAVLDSGTSTPDALAPGPASDIVVPPASKDAEKTIPEIVGIPATLLLAGLIAVGGGALVLRNVIRR
jgi:hypothetical protein